MFHVGFLIADDALLESAHASLTAAGCDPSAIEYARLGAFRCGVVAGDVAAPDPSFRAGGFAAAWLTIGLGI
jgi:hypothetical protein